jgi:hypothetical protein
MACFLAPLAEAIVVSAVRFSVKKKEKKEKIVSAWNKRLALLEKMLWGGELMLIVDHLISGELVPYPPFLTATSSPETTKIMLEEIWKVGGAMCLLVTTVWVIAVIVNEYSGSKKSAENQ